MQAILATTDEYPGALKNGTRVKKTNSKPRDNHKDGALATVYGSIGHPDLLPLIGYFVIWDDLPGLPCLITGDRIEAGGAP